MFNNRKPFQTNKKLSCFKKQYLGLLFFLILINSACEFSPSEIPETFVLPHAGNAPVLLIEVQPEMDTLKLATDVWAEFKIITQGTKVNTLKILFDTEVVYDGHYDESFLPKIHLSIHNYTEGFHQFTIQTFTSAGTGSIADKVGSEGFLYEANWAVFINHNASKEIAIKNIHYTKDGVFLNWEKYDYHDFQKYVVFKTSAIQGNEKNYSFTNPYVIGLIDSSYIEGEYASYGVSVNGEHGNSVDFFQPIKTPEVEIVEGGEMEVKWEKVQNENAFGYYHVSMMAPDSYKHEIVKNENINDTTAIYPSPGFGGIYELQVRYIPKTYKNEYVGFNTAGGHLNYSLGHKMSSYSKGYEINNSENVLLYKNSYLYKYDAKRNFVVDSLSVPDLSNPGLIRVSPEGNFVCYFTQDKCEVRQVSDWNLVNSFRVPFVNFGNASLRSVSLSDNNKLVVVDFSSVIQVIDVITGKEIFRKVAQNGALIADAVVNASGDKILYDFKKYEVGRFLRLASFNGNSLVDIGETKRTDSGANYEILQYTFNEDKVIMLKNIDSYSYAWEVRNVEDFALLNYVELPEDFVPVGIDFDNSQFVMRYGLNGTIFDYSHSLYFDMDSGEKNKIKLIVGKRDFILSDGVLMNKTGRYLSINELVIQE